MLMVGRKYEAASGYRYGFNGKENDNEMKGEGNQQDYGMRIYDPRLGRFLSVDPLSKKYPELTPYQFSSNTPIQGVDLDGMEVYYAADGTLLGKVGKNTQVRVVDNAYIEDSKRWIASLNKGNKDYYASKFLPALSKDIGMSNEELNLRASLATLKQAEAGRTNPPADYNSWYGTGNVFTDKTYEEDPTAYSKHPGKNDDGYSAAGAYQFIEKYYYGENSLTQSFSPKAQDQAVVNLMTPEGYEAAKAGDVETLKTSLSEKWTSLPYWTTENLSTVFKKSVSAELTNNSKIGAPKGTLLTQQTQELRKLRDSIAAKKKEEAKQKSKSDSTSKKTKQK